MIDKVQKIREEVERIINRRLNLINGDYFDLNEKTNGFTNEIMDIIYSLQEEPVSEETMTIRKEWFEHCKKSWYSEGYIDGKYNRKSQFEELASEDLEKAAEEYVERFYREHNIKPEELPADKEISMADYKAGAEWQKQKDLKWLADNHKQIFNNGWADGYEDGRDSMEEDMTKDAVCARCFGFQSGEALFSIKLPADKYLVGSEIKVVIIKEDSV